MHESYKKWLKDGKLKVICKCGCGKEIIIKESHKFNGIPKYILGHGSIGKNNPNFGKHHTEEAKQKMREKKLGISLTKEHKQKISEATIGENNPNFGKHHSKETRQKISDNLPDTSGENNPNWKGGITPLTILIRMHEKYKEWRLQIFGRDNFTCQCCGIRGNYLEAHHIKTITKIIRKYNINNINDALNCDLLWNLNNGITYCIKCHKKLKSKGGILETIIQ